MKSTTKAKLEHRLQVAFYHDMLAHVLGDADVAFSRIDLGIVYRGPARAEGDALADEEQAQQAAAQALLGARDALLEVIVGVEDYLCEVREMVTGPDAVVNRIAETKFSDTFFHLSYKCDGCLYQQWCMKAAFENDDLSLIPTLTASEKRTLLAAGLSATAEVAALMRITAKPGGRPELVPAKGQEDVVQRLRASSVGPRLSEIVHRAKSVRSARCREIAKAEAGREEANAEANDQTKGRKEVTA